MKLNCHRPSLLTALQVVSGVVPSRTPHEVLRNIKLQVDSGEAILIGTDQEVGIRQHVDSVETASTGQVLMPASRVTSILRELQEEQVTIEATEQSLVVRGGQSDFNLSTEDPAEFPAVAAFEDENYFTVPSNVLREMIRRTAFATDLESTRDALGGILLEFAADKVTLAATDSRRLAVVSAACESVGETNLDSVSPVVPSKAMQLIEKSLPDSDDPAQIAVHANHVLVKCGGSTVYSRLVEGRFPRYGDVIPKEFKANVELVVSQFYSAVRQAQIVTSEESRGVDFAFTEGSLTLSSQAADVGKSSVVLPIAYSGDPITVTFDPKFVADFLRIIDSGTSITLNLIDAESPAVFTTDDGYQYVVMPLSRDQ